MLVGRGKGSSGPTVKATKRLCRDAETIATTSALGSRTIAAGGAVRSFAVGHLVQVEIRRYCRLVYPTKLRSRSGPTYMPNSSVSDRNYIKGIAAYPLATPEAVIPQSARFSFGIGGQAPSLSKDRSGVESRQTLVRLCVTGNVAVSFPRRRRWIASKILDATIGEDLEPNSTVAGTSALGAHLIYDAGQQRLRRDIP